MNRLGGVCSRLLSASVESRLNRRTVLGENRTAGGVQTNYTRYTSFDDKNYKLRPTVIPNV